MQQNRDKMRQNRERLRLHLHLLFPEEYDYELESQYILQGRKAVPQTQHPRVTRIWSADARTKTRTRFISEMRLVVLLCIAVERHCCGKCSGPEAAPLLSIVHSESWLKSRGVRSRALERKLPRSVYPKLFPIRSRVTIKSAQIVGTTLVGLGFSSTSKGYQN